MKACLEFSLACIAALCVTACDSSPTQPRSDLSGRYLLTTTESCGGGRESFEVYVTQMGTQIGFLLGVDTGSVEGTVHGDTVDVKWIKQSDAGIICSSELAGTATIGGRAITGSVSGSSNSRSCFNCVSDAITFTLVRR